MDGGGTIDFAEFMVMMTKNSPDAFSDKDLGMESEMRDAFGEFDKGA